MSKSHELPAISLPSKMESVIDPEKVLSNKYNYPEFNWNPDIHEQKALARVREMFLNIELSHATASDPKLLQTEGIIPPSDFTDRQDWRSQTGKLDKSLGLDHCTFLHWGALHPTGNGRYIFPVEARDILLSPETIVTPYDIHSTMCTYMMNTDDIRALDEEGQRRLNEYLETIVPGKDWVDIIARRALRRMQHADDKSVYKVRSHSDLGEIKHLGAISPTSLHEPIDIHDQQTMYSKWLSLLENNGLAVSYITNMLEFGSTEDKTALQASLNKSRKLWRKILDIAQKS